ncbi:hypothetical protein AB1Y20_015529 [Prymnesium parvum]|uniref:Heme-binding protein 2 n=1 Tax=Prymnesium parvum TaxID=97485 RepID=A0AB34K0H8_PRYPA
MGMVLGRIAEEMPTHTVIYHAPTFEVRRYAPSVLAECRFDGKWGSSGNEGSPFMQLAKYIGVFGEAENQAANKIAMTAPVLVTPERIAMTAPVLVSQDGGSRGDTMAFVLPASKYQSVADAPTPTNPNITLRQLPERTQAVQTFTWSFRADRAQQHLAMLLSDLEKDGKYKPKRNEQGEVDWQAAGYNPPFAIPFMKRNEVLVSVMEA